MKALGVLVAAACLCASTAAGAVTVDGAFASGEWAGAFEHLRSYGEEGGERVAVLSSLLYDDTYIYFGLQAQPAGEGLDDYEATLVPGALNPRFVIDTTPADIVDNLVVLDWAADCLFVPGGLCTSGTLSAAGALSALTLGGTYDAGGAATVFEAAVPWALFTDQASVAGFSAPPPGGVVRWVAYRFTSSNGGGCRVLNTICGTAIAPAISSVPEPGSWALLLVGLGALGAAFRTKRGASGLFA